MTEDHEGHKFPVPLASDEEIAAFIARYGRPYDPETDDYHREPFVADTREGKNDPIYNAHSYHTKVPPRAIIPYILHYTEPGDIVLDPFCGSGMTGVAALLCEDPPEDLLHIVPGAKKGARRAILNDLSPAACHIAYNYVTPVDVEALKTEFERIKVAVKPEMDWLYGTEHFEPAVGLYDPKNPEVARRLKNRPDDVPADELLPLADEERTWHLLDRAEVERRMGPDALARQPLPDGVEHFVCIPATIQYTIWSDVYKCQGTVTVEEPTGRINKRTGKPSVKKIRRPRGCGAEIILWDAAVDHAKGDVREQFECPTCGLPWKKVSLKRIATIPVVTVCKFNGLRAKRAGATETTIPYEAVREHTTTACELELIAQIRERPLDLPVPSAAIDTKGPQYTRNALSARQVRELGDFYTRRNLRALSALFDEAYRAPGPVREKVIFALTSTFGHVERMTRYKFKKGGNSALSGQLYFPSFPVEDNVQRQLQSKIRQVFRFLEAMPRTLACTAQSHALVSCSHAARLKALRDDSVDYVFADPPFGSNIYYSEVNWLCEAWLGK